MKLDKFYEELDSYFAKQEIDKVDPFLVASLAQAKEEEDYGAYIGICNEMIGFYRSVSAFEKAYVAAEDVLLLMEHGALRHHPSECGHGLPGGGGLCHRAALLQTGAADLQRCSAAGGLPVCGAL